ncbi:hypothetical protein W97_00056 [Coniosporium apollinis CBS 100218]|uniref:Fungal N-terminal domain-containing protein n=1 Tax=Coniosporium apollinis (strain CBS 100218) TaxID=1168221 RepID=R7YGQ8_CONA1|nr:uncharacterized protein W97_00056 [Coniosporium apollinis CBS 100218]EON60846.1 hypothetical protein W97_00056 [Coniosporium apollinis CBS 100218]
MGEPLSIAASIAGLSSLASELTKACFACYRAYKKARNAPDTIDKVIRQLSLFRRLLVDLEDIYIIKSGPLSSLDSIEREVKECQSEIKMFQQSLNSSLGDGHGMKLRVKFLLKEEEIQAFLCSLQVYQSAFESAKANDGLRIAMSTQQTVATIGIAVQSIQQEASAEKDKLLSDEALKWLTPWTLCGDKKSFITIAVTRALEPGS